MLVVGAGFAGSVVARQLADLGVDITVIERRSHIGGNAYDTYDAHGFLIHPYGPHIFHTNSDRVFEYLSRFTAWRPYEHRVRAVVDGVVYPFPINRTTINRLYGLSLSEQGVRDFLASVAEERRPVATSEDVVVGAVGEDLFLKFFSAYTRKQWGIEARDLAPSVAARIPFRVNDDDRYFTDIYQAMPRDGYHVLFGNLLDHSRIRIATNTSYIDVRSEAFDHVIFTGPIDEFFDYCLGALPYRSLRFEHEHLEGVDAFQETGTFNYPDDRPYTRITEFKHLTGQHARGTSIVREYPTDQGDPYYPVPRDANEALAAQYRKRAASRDDVTFVGRLAQYRYYNMDQVVAAALVAAERIAGRFSLAAPPMAPT
jgi:UDP-galactopyranose mutase